MKSVRSLLFLTYIVKFNRISPTKGSNEFELETFCRKIIANNHPDVASVGNPIPLFLSINRYLLLTLTVVQMYFPLSFFAT